jgi:hypothetical protein
MLHPAQKLRGAVSVGFLDVAGAAARLGALDLGRVGAGRRGAGVGSGSGNSDGPADRRRRTACKLAAGISLWFGNIEPARRQRGDSTVWRG